MLKSKLRAFSMMKRIALPVIAMAVVSGCEMPKAPKAANPTVAFPLVVSDETRSISIEVPVNGGAVSNSQTDGVRRFVQDFLDRGKGAIIVETSAFPDNKSAADKQASRVSEILSGYGVRASEIALIPGAIKGASSASVNMTFTASKVTVPECGEWDVGSSFTYTNRPHTNFGCTYRRNLGLMIADPADLVRAKTMDNQDPVASQRVIDLMREGEATERMMNAGQARAYKGTTD